MDLTLLLSFITASFLLIIMPGTDNIFVLTESAVNGSRNGIAISAGLALGLIMHTALAASGLSLIFKNSPTAYEIVKYLGAGYLLYLAFQSYVSRKNISEDNDKHNKKSTRKLILKGVILNITNPKVALFFIAFFPQFVNSESGNIMFQMFILGLIFMTMAFLIFSTIALISGRLQKLLSNYKFRLYTNYVKTIVLLILGLIIIFIP